MTNNIRTVYQGRLFSVELDHIRLPNGRKHEFAVIRHAPSVILIPIQDDGRVVLKEECGCAASSGFFKTCERHDDLKTLSQMKAYLALRKNLLKSAAEAQERFNKGSQERYNKRARLRERTKAHEDPPITTG